MGINRDTKKIVDTKNQQNSSGISFELSEPKFNLDDLVLSEDTKNEIIRAISLRKHQKVIYEDWGFQKTHRHDKKVIINLYGEPGTGKTMSAHAIANALGSKLLIVNYADIESKYVGETPKNIRAAFTFAKKNNAIILFDEADAILSRRVTNMNSSTDTSVNQTRSVMLTILNDYDNIVIFATNFIRNYDPAFMRRILIHIKYSLPDEEIRSILFRHYIPLDLPHEINIEEAVKESEGLSGSDISNSIILAAFGAKSDGRDKVSNEDLIHKIKSIKQSKKANEEKLETVKTQIVSDDYVKEQFKGVEQ